MEVGQNIASFAAGPIQMPVKRVKVIRPPSFSPNVLLQGIAELVPYRDLLYTLTVHRIKIRYKQSALGLGWALIQPLAMMLVYTVIFSLFLTRVPTQGSHYSLFVLCGILPWNFFQTALSSSATGLVSNGQLIPRSISRREILPLSYVLLLFFDFLVAAVILAAMMGWYRVPVGIEILYLPSILAVEFIFLAGLALLLGALQVRLRDIGLAMPLILQLWMFCVPVVYSYSDVPARFRFLYSLDPMVGIVENFRRVLIQGIGPDLPLLLISFAGAMIVLPLGTCISSIARLQWRT